MLGKLTSEVTAHFQEFLGKTVDLIETFLPRRGFHYWNELHCQMNQVIIKNPRNQESPSATETHSRNVGFAEEIILENKARLIFYTL